MEGIPQTLKQVSEYGIQESFYIQTNLSVNFNKIGKNVSGVDPTPGKNSFNGRIMENSQCNTNFDSKSPLAYFPLYVLLNERVVGGKF